MTAIRVLWDLRPLPRIHYTPTPGAAGTCRVQQSNLFTTVRSLLFILLFIPPELSSNVVLDIEHPVLYFAVQSTF